MKIEGLRGGGWIFKENIHRCYDFNIFDVVKFKLLKLIILRRVVVPPGTGGLARRAVTGGIKKRLGVLGNRENFYATLLSQC